MILCIVYEEIYDEYVGGISPTPTALSLASSNAPTPAPTEGCPAPTPAPTRDGYDR